MRMYVSVGRRAGQGVAVHAPGHQGRFLIAASPASRRPAVAKPSRTPSRGWRKWPPRLVVGHQVLSAVADWDYTTRRPSANGSCNLHDPVRVTGGAHVEEGREGSTLCRPTMAIGRRRGPPWAAGGLGGGGGGGAGCDARDGRQRPTDPSLPRPRYTVPPWLAFHRLAPWKCYWETPRDLTIYGTTAMAGPPGESGRHGGLAPS